MVIKEINNFIAKEEKVGKKPSTEGPNSSNENGKIAEVGKAEEIYLVPVGCYQREIARRKTPMAVRMEDNKSELTIKPLTIHCSVDDDSLEPWTFISVAWTMKPADKDGGIGKRSAGQRSGVVFLFQFHKVSK